ncbi:ABC transporter ATP-binding protein [Pseudooceanicola sediminis]|uniref:ABC transporter ATP-binding protein n=1 Tax=Pseudooceanicola sediminis TaxID=2211117 RepID=A0A399J3E5_9RHOB|nr:ABC transporter ATP-binding protein [Pseudooceanicola sediminis]KAA2314208.1 ABC transporter ATP-binding protein [Puniceibacterium sp. HSS470]RII39933.1 ABC transporter ATP-binding protein [Pseudooceanicola sediminis]|tara:strand:- start:98159 stop:98863 length:705 start_codon:yes stop_codon:yes gene_type:complete
MSLLSLRGLRTSIGQYAVLHDVSIEVPEGGVFVLLGRNGAGKTTTLRSVMGLWSPSPASVFFRGRDLSGMHTADIARLGIAFVPENMGIFGGLSVAENMVLATRTGQFDKSRLAYVQALFPALEKFWDSRAGSLSGGQKQMLAVARAIIEPRELILVDEPTKGLAPAIVDAMADAFAEIGQNTTILLVEQNFQFARRLGRDMAVIDDGRIVHAGSMAEFAANADLQDRLLGLAV